MYLKNNTFVHQYDSPIFFSLQMIEIHITRAYKSISLGPFDKKILIKKVRKLLIFMEQTKRTIGSTKDAWQDLDVVNYAIANALAKTYSIVKPKIIEYFSKLLSLIFQFLIILVVFLIIFQLFIKCIFRDKYFLRISLLFISNL